MTNILVAGITVADFIFEVPELPSAAEKYTAAAGTITTGGCAANAAIAISRLGGNVWLASRVGDDVVGDLIAANLASQSVNTSLMPRSPSGRTAFSSISIDTAGERQIVNFRGENLQDNTDLITHDAPPVNAVLTDTRWEAGAVATMELARKRQIPAVLDAEPPVTHAAVSRATHVAFSRQGLCTFTGIDDPVRALTVAASDMTAWICVTDGANGVYYTENRQLQHVPAVSVNAIDTLGAGDVWHGAFTLKLGQGSCERNAIVFANTVAAVKCTRAGGGSVSPTLDELDAFTRDYEN